MKTKLFLAGALLVGVASVASAQTDDQIVTITVNAINTVTLGADVALTISSLTAPGTQTSTYAVSTNSSTDKVIVASIDVDDVAGLALRVNLAAPTGGVSSGLTLLSTTPVSVVTSITNVAESGLLVTYSATATAAVAPAAYPRTVTYTIQ